MKLVYQDFFFQYHSDYYEGHEITFRRNVFTNEIVILFNDELARAFGFVSVEDMMLDDDVLDKMNEIYRQTGIFPVQTSKL